MTSLPLSSWRALYALARWLLYPWLLVRPYQRARREPEYAERVGERWGHLPSGLGTGVVWFHTVSAGEAIAAAPLVDRLATDFPGASFLVTSTTPTGAAQLRLHLVDKHANVKHCYAPYDYPRAVERFFAAVQPRLLVLLETELWPNLLRRAAADDVPALLVNARLSERSARGYERVRAMTASMLEQLTFIACQYPQHAERFLSLGAAPSRLGVLGSLKFDAELSADHDRRVAALRVQPALAGRRLWVAGSTHPGEERIVLKAHRQLRARFGDLLLVLAPRHPSRAEALLGLLRSDELRAASFSEGGDGNTDVLVVDTMGDLLSFYGAADVAFLGGSLVSVGGHNPIEAALCARPLLMGPETFNFPDVVAAFQDAGVLKLVKDADTLAEAVAGLLGDDAQRQALGERARAVVLENRGALQRLYDLLAAQLEGAGLERR